MSGETLSMAAGSTSAATEDTPELPAARWQSDDRRRPWWKIWLPILLLSLVADLGFPAVFWRVPKLSSSLDDYGYQFFHDLRELQSTPAHGLRVVAFGSSVAGGLDTYQLSGLLGRDFPGKQIEVRRLLHPGIKPSDFRLLWGAELDRVDVEVLVAVFNLVDFLNPSVGRELKPAIRKILPPWPTLRARGEHVSSVTDKLAMALAGASNLYRFRKAIRSAIRDHAKLLVAWWSADGERSYGVYSDGYTKPRFATPANALREVYVDPRWIEQRGRATLVVSYGGREVMRAFTEAGWHPLIVGADEEDGMVHVVVEGGWSPAASGEADDDRLLGVRLRSGLATADRRPAPRYPPFVASDIKPFRRMGSDKGDAYVARWQVLLEADTEFGKRFRQYRDGKRALARRPFAAELEVAEMRAMVEWMAASGRRVLMVNMPESPLLGDVVGSPYYAGYLDFFTSIAARNERIAFIDLHDLVPFEDMNDWHHLSYVGQLKLGRAVAPALRDVVAAALDQGGGAT